MTEMADPVYVDCPDCETDVFSRRADGAAQDRSSAEVYECDFCKTVFTEAVLITRRTHGERRRAIHGPYKQSDTMDQR